MSIHVDPNWWKTLFDEVYLMTDARSVCDEEITRQEIDIFTALVPMAPQDRILDLCGGHGRHSLELCRRGYNSCTVVDYSQTLLDIGGRNAAAENRSVQFRQGDARHTDFTEAAFDHVLILGNSLGYITDTNADLDILKESKRLVKPQGWLLLDVSDGAAIDNKLHPQAWHEIGDDIVVCRRREVKEGRICARELVLSKQQGIIRDQTYCIRLYRADALAALVTRAGFTEVTVHTDVSAMNTLEDVGCMNHRLVVVAKKP